MINKEFKDVLLPVTIRLLTGILIIAVVLVFIYFSGQRRTGSETYILIPFLMSMGAIIIWIANSLGITAFTKEYRDDAFEYLLSSPFSKLEIFYKKIIPRLIILFSLTVPYIVINHIFIESEILKDTPMLKPLPFFIFSTLIFLNAFFLSLFSWKNIKMVVWVIYAFPMIWMGYILLYLQKILNISDKTLSNTLLFNISLFIIVVILGFAFYMTFEKFDIKSESIHKKRFLIYSGIPLVLIVVLGIISAYLYNS